MDPAEGSSARKVGGQREGVPGECREERSHPGIYALCAGRGRRMGECPDILLLVPGHFHCPSIGYVTDHFSLRHLCPVVVVIPPDHAFTETLAVGLCPSLIMQPGTSAPCHDPAAPRPLGLRAPLLLCVLPVPFHSPPAVTTRPPGSALSLSPP